MDDEGKLAAHIEFARKLYEKLKKDSTCTISDFTDEVSKAIEKTTSMLKAIISIKSELNRLTLNFCETEYVENYIEPILKILFSLSLISIELSISVSVLTFSPIVPSKKSKIKDTIHLIYNINEECIELYMVLKKRLKQLY